MRPISAPLVALVFLTTAYAGCFGDEATKAAFTATALDEAKTKYKFDAGGSTGEGIKFEWDFGDTTETSTAKVVEHTYQYLNGMYTVTLKVTDSSGKSDRVSQKVQVGSGTNAEPVLFLTVDKRWVTPGEEVMFDATQSYDDDGDPLRFEWDFNSDLSQDQFSEFQNLGEQAYGRYKYGPPKESNETSGESTTTPSGHNWAEEVEKARKRLLEKAGVTTLDGGHGATVPEPRNPDFDGTISDESPVQFFTFPEGPDPATYFVMVTVRDVKGDGATGYIRIRVSSSVPEAKPEVKQTDVALHSSLLVNAHDGTNVVVFKLVPQTINYPVVATATLTFASDPANSPGTTSAVAHVCAGSQTNGATCKGAALGKTAGGSGQSVVVTRGPDTAMPNAITLMVENTGQNNLKYSTTMVLEYDLNPWAQEEAGFGGHH